MLVLPLHEIDSEYAVDFKLYLNSVTRFTELYSIINEEQTILYRYKEQAQNYLNTNKLKLEINTINKITLGTLYNVAPCSYCSSNNYLTDDLRKVEMRLYEQEFIESLYLETAKELFENKNIQRLLMISKDILEHFNPGSGVAHFYLGFCFYTIGDEVNFQQALVNLTRTDPRLAQQLITISQS
mgnify:CR=1 FL=1